MPDELLEKARQQAEHADLSVRAAALLRIARAESACDVSRARRTLLEGLDAVQKLTGAVRDYLLDEARRVAAAVSPELLTAIPVTQDIGPRQFACVGIVQTMLAHGHVNAAFNYVIHHDDPESFPFLSTGGVVNRLDPRDPERRARRLALLRHAFEMWRKAASNRQHGSSHFVRLFGHFWKEFSPEEALSVARTVVDRATKEPDAGTSSGYPDEIYFFSRRQDTMFQILHVLRHLDPTLAQSLVNAHDQLAAAVRRYPNGMETLEEEAEAEAQRRKADGVSCGGGYALAGDPKDFDRQRRLSDAARSGDFETSIEDALEKYWQDTAPETRNYAPKEYWPSTGAFRTMFYQAGIRLGPEAVTLLERIPDDDLRLFATIELSAALAGIPESSITSTKEPHPADSPRIQASIVAASCTTGIHRAERRGPMRSPDGRLIRCPKCLSQPSDDVRWSCKCGHIWNTFRTAGKCPACDFQWEVTRCPQCGEISEHRAWYQPEP